MVEVNGNGKPYRTEVKRFKIPVSVTATCFGCSERVTKDFAGIHYLGYPTANEPFIEHFYCDECGTETPVRLILKISLEVADG